MGCQGDLKVGIIRQLCIWFFKEQQQKSNCKYGLKSNFLPVTVDDVSGPWKYIYKMLTKPDFRIKLNLKDQNIVKINVCSLDLEEVIDVYASMITSNQGLEKANK